MHADSSSEVNAEPPGPQRPTAAPAMGHSVVRGSLWMLLNTAITRGASFLAQIALGWLLSKHDFGVYALAMSVSMLAAVLRDGGVKQLLVQRQGDYHRLIGPVFWMAFAFNTLTGIIIAGLAPLLAVAYHESQVAWLMLVIAISQPLGTPGAILATRLQIDLRFREAGAIASVSAVVRYLGAVALAWLGFGPLSFVLPLPALALIEWGLGWWYTRERPWRAGAVVRSWWGMFGQARWVLAGTLGVAALNMGANVVIGFLVPLNVVGVYFFAFQIVVQVGMLMAANVTQVLFAALSKIADDPERKRAALGRALRQVMLLSGPLCMGIVVTFAPLELLIWKGKWADAADAVELIGLFYPATMAASVALAAVQARGSFRAWGLGLLFMAVVTLAGAAAGAALHGTAAGVAAYAGIAGMAAALLVTVWGLVGSGVSVGAILRDTFPAWLLSIAAAAAAMNIDMHVVQPALPPFTGAGEGLPLQRLALVLRLAIISGCFVSIFAVLVRLLLSEHLREGLDVTPQRLRPLARFVFRVR